MSKKSVSIVLIICGVMLVAISLIKVAESKRQKHIYYRDMVVIDTTDDSLVLQDINGNVWEALADNYNLTDTVIVGLDDNDTSYTIYDDKIISIKPLIVGSY